MASSIKNLTQKIERMKGRLEKKPVESAERGAVNMTADMRANVGQHDAIASSELLNGIVINRGDAAFGPGRSIRVVSTAPHSGFVEFGTGPKHVPNPYTEHYDKPAFSGQLVAALTEWAAIKPTIQTQNPGAVGWAVARVISGEADDSVGGTEPQPFFFTAWEKHKGYIVARTHGRAKREAYL